VPWAKIGSPGLASGHSDDQDDNGDGTIGLEIMQPMIRACDFFCHHDYWFEATQTVSEWYGMRWTRAMEIVGWDMPLWIDECGWFGHNEGDPNAGAIYDTYFRSPDWTGVNPLGVCIFIWDSDDSHVGQRISRNPPLVASLGELLRTSPPPIPPPDDDIVDYRDLLEVHPTRRFDTRPRSAINRWIAHHTASTASVEAVARYHVNTRGWAGIGYHYYIEPDGRILLVGGLDTIRAHAYGENEDTVGVALQGLYTDTWPTDAQLDSLARLLATQPEWTVQGHYDVANTICPGMWFGEWLESFNEEPPDDELATILRNLDLLDMAVEDVVEYLGAIRELLE
jgi:hypothetical protein